MPTLNAETQSADRKREPSRENISTGAADAARDHALMLAARDGQLDCLGELFELHHRRLYAFCARMTGHAHAAEDLVQIVFERMLKYRRTYRDDGNFLTWMYHLARNCIADHFRRQSSAPLTVEPDELHAHASGEMPPDVRTVQVEDLALLHAALAKLSRDDREIIMLSRFENLGHREAARILECSEGAAKVRAHRALKTLREIYLALQRDRHSQIQSWKPSSNQSVRL